MAEMQKMQQHTNDAMHELAQAGSHEEAEIRFKGLMKMIRSKSFADRNKKISETIERLSESEREIEDDQEEDENTDEVMEIEKITRNSISDHVKFSISESDGKKKRKKNEFE